MFNLFYWSDIMFNRLQLAKEFSEFLSELRELIKPIIRQKRREINENKDSSIEFFGKKLLFLRFNHKHPIPESTNLTPYHLTGDCDSQFNNLRFFAEDELKPKKLFLDMLIGEEFYTDTKLLDEIIDIIFGVNI